VGRSPTPSVSRARRGRQQQLLEPVQCVVTPSTMLLVLHRYRALAVRESITALRASLPPAADAPPEKLPQQEALATALHDFDIGSFVGLSAPVLLPECQPAEWANARRNRPFPQGLLDPTVWPFGRHRASIRIKTLTGKSVNLCFEEAEEARVWKKKRREAAPLRPGESIWSRIYVWQLANILHDREGHPPDVMQFMFDDAGTYRPLHPLLSLEACGVFGAAVTLHVRPEPRERPGFWYAPGINGLADAYAGPWLRPVPG
jgi:hypothetical protein